MIGELMVKLTAETTDFLVPVKQAKTGLEDVSDQANAAIFQIDGMATSLSAVSTASQALGFVSQRLTIISKTAGLAATVLGYLSAGVGVVGGVAFKVASAIGVLLVPIEGLIIAVRGVTSAVLLMARTIIAPFKILISMFMGLFRAVVAVSKPLISMAFFVFKVKIAIQSLKFQIKFLWKFFGMLSPRLKLIVGSLMALGLAGRAGSAAMGILSKATQAATVAVLAFTQPLAALKIVALGVATSVFKLTANVIRLTKSLASLAITGTIAGFKALGLAILNVSRILTASLIGVLAKAAKWFALISGVAIGWGVKLASELEQAQVAFQTMLKSASAARAVLGELEQFAASTPFQLKDLQDGAKQLLNAQVPAAELTDKLRILGDIAAGTGKPIKDFVRIFAKVKSTGKVSLESLNQLAERGVPIYTALSSELGKSREQMLSMISKGEVGFKDLNAAIESTATGTGVFAGGMAAQSQTIAGLWSTLKDNVSFAARSLGQNIAEAFNLKGSLANSITFFQGLRSRIEGMFPIFQAMASSFRAAFAAMQEIGMVVFNSIGSLFGGMTNDVMATAMEMFAIITWGFKSWPDIAELAFKKTQLFAVQAFGHITHFFTGVLPALLNWFGDNWRSIFLTAADLVLTVFINLGKNLRSIWSGVMDFIAGKGFNVDFTPLTEGFKNTVSEMPDIPERAVSEMEKNLSSGVDRLTTKVAGDLQSEIEKNMSMLEDFRNKKPEEASLADAQLPDKQESDDPMAGTDVQSGAGKRELGVMERGSQEAFKAIFGNRGNKQLAEQKQSNKHLKQIAESVKKKKSGDGMNVSVQGAV